MARAPSSLEDILRDAVAPVLRRFSVLVARRMAGMAAERMDGDLRAARRSAGGRRARPARRPARRGDITRWVADRRARRVPTFVIEMTGGLDTKKKIIARFGADAAFEKGRPLPRAR